MAEIAFFGQYCEDIRREFSGKTILIGAYGTTMVTGKFPARIPKMCLNFCISLPPKAGNKTAKVLVLVDNEVFTTIDMEILVAENEIYEERALVYGGFEIASPLISKPGIITSQLHIDGEVYPGPFLKVKEATPEEKVALNL